MLYMHFEAIELWRRCCHIGLLGDSSNLGSPSLCDGIFRTYEPLDPIWASRGHLVIFENQLILAVFISTHNLSQLLKVAVVYWLACLPVNLEIGSSNPVSGTLLYEIFLLSTLLLTRCCTLAPIRQIANQLCQA